MRRKSGQKLLARISLVCGAIALLLTVIGVALPASAGASANPVTAAVNSVKETIFKVKSGSSPLFEIINYAITEKSVPRTEGAANGSYGNPLEGVSLNGLPSIPGVGEGLPLEDGANADL